MVPYEGGGAKIWFAQKTRAVRRNVQVAVAAPPPLSVTVVCFRPASRSPSKAPLLPLPLLPPRPPPLLPRSPPRSSPAVPQAPRSPLPVSVSAAPSRDPRIHPDRHHRHPAGARARPDRLPMRSVGVCQAPGTRWLSGARKERNYAQGEGRTVQDSLEGSHSLYCTSHLLDE
jgi:hypothetical protein